MGTGKDLPLKEISSGAARCPLRILVDLRTDLFFSTRYSAEKGISALFSLKISSCIKVYFNVTVVFSFQSNKTLERKKKQIRERDTSSETTSTLYVLQL